MKKKTFILAMLSAIGLTANAENTKQTVTQVTSGVELKDNVDYIITGTSPFATAGSINITNTDHAVIILQNIRPSKVTSAILSHIYINGEAAVKGDLTSANAIKGSNCQVKMYNQGSIIMPYAQDIKPLTVYTEQNFAGEECNNYSEGHSGGYMKSLTEATMNNKIRSFKLKRGYMVTFAVGTGGWGYSRCFIADNEDLEIATLPTILDQRISSYRIFKWWNSSKKGVHHTGADANAALGTTWAFDWAQGNASLLPDVEWVPNHIYEDWPSTSTIGSVTGSCHTKANNEPANSADDTPQSVETVLNNWENMMRTGLRLCSPATHDGGWGWHNDFMKAIDDRGWRCDIVDFHGYWDGEWGSLDWRIDTYAFGRPVWFSEWLWGASWNHNGAFADGRKSDDATYNGTKPILERMNGNSRVERYAYWNSEQWFTQIWRDNKLTKLGEYYGKMNSGLAFNKSNQFVPRETKLVAPSDPTSVYQKATSSTPATVKIDWSDANGDLMTSLDIECQFPGTTTWKKIGEVAPKDKNSKAGANYTFSYVPEEPGTYAFRIKETSYNNKTFTSAQTIVNVAPSMGNDIVQYGTLTFNNTDASSIDFSPAFAEVPSIFMGPVSNANTDLYPGNLVTGVAKTKFTYQLLPWQTSKSTTFSKSEDISFMAMQPGNYKFGSLDCEVGVAKVNMVDTATVTFQQAFPEGITPVILTELRNPSLKTSPIIIKIKEVSNTGFKCILMYEDIVGSKSRINQNVSYLAITPGNGYISEEEGIAIAAGKAKEVVYGTLNRPVYFTVNSQDGETTDTISFIKPKVFANLQTNNYDAATLLRMASEITVKAEDGVTYTQGIRIKRITDSSRTTASDGTKLNATNMKDDIGWVVIANVDPVITPVTINDITSLIDRYLNQTEGTADAITINDITTLIDKYLAQ